MSSSSFQSSSDGSFVSASSGPIRTLNVNNFDEMMMAFYSLPSSPTKKPSWRSSYSCDLGANQTNPCGHVALGDGGSSDFEFDTSGQLFVDEYDFEQTDRKRDHRRYHGSLPAMAFADELFCDGQVMPLRPPPRFFYATDNEDSGTYGSLPATPRSTSASRKISFPRRSLWNDEFDPFTTALENVKLEKRGKSKSGHKKSHRRVRSMSPIGDKEPNKEDSMSRDPAQEEWKQVEPIFSPRTQVEPTRPYSFWAPEIANGRPPVLRPNKDQKGPMKLAEPKGVIFARRAKMVKMGYDCPMKSNMAKATREDGEKPKGEKDEKKKKLKIKKFLRKSFSKIKAIDKHQKPEDVKIPKSNNLEKKSTKSMDWAQAQAQTNCKEKDQLAEVTKMTLVHYKPKMLLCMGFGSKYAK